MRQFITKVSHKSPSFISAEGWKFDGLLHYFAIFIYFLIISNLIQLQPVKAEI